MYRYRKWLKRDYEQLMAYIALTRFFDRGVGTDRSDYTLLTVSNSNISLRFAAKEAHAAL